ncbi:pyridoxal phosphate-dependent aminotransferase [Candidatus Kaiserbacteria bacterium]|nr:pyridoxal phosphate-dependent aminotransferase [Candidatus Kaiserbacteria bacterium]
MAKTSFDAQKLLAKRVLRIGDSAIRKMMTTGHKVAGAISLAQGIPDAKTPLYIREGITELLKENDKIGKYSLGPGLPELRQIVADTISKKGNFSVDPDKNVCITAGAIEALAITISSIVDEGDEAILFDPGYPPYIPQVVFSGGTPVLVPLQAENGWKIDLKKLQAAVTPKTKALIVCNPSNPTGMVMGKEELDAIAALAAEHGFFVIADLTYEFLVYDKGKIPTLLAYPEIRDRLIICYSFSKEFSMTGWRAGYLYAPEKVLEQALKVHDEFLLCAPTPSQYAALVALTKKPNDDPEGLHAEMATKRELICERLDRLGDLFSYTKPRGAYYILAKYKKPDIDSWAFAMRMLNEAKVIVIPGVACGSQGEGHVRFSYGASKEKIHEAFDRIEAWAKTL